jgi:chromatin assembly factor 1 subunit B
MLAKTLEINWHDGQAIYSVDFSPDGSRYATAGADNSVRVRNTTNKADYAPQKKTKELIYISRSGVFKNDPTIPQSI